MEDRFTKQEEQLRGLSEDFTLDIDTSELWSKVEAQLPPVEEDNRRPIIWWFASGAMILAIGLLVWNYTEKSEAYLPVAQLESKSPIEIQNLNTKLNNQHTEKTPLLSESSAITSPSKNQSIIKEKTIENKKINISAIFNSNRYDEKSATRNKEEINQNPTDIASFEELINASIPLVVNSADEESNKESKETRALISSVMLHTSSLGLIENEENYPLFDQQIKPLKVTSWLPYISLSSGTSIHNNSISSNTNEVLDPNQFKNEKSLVGLRSDLRLGLENSNGWRFGFGLSHNRLVNRYSRNDIEITSSEISGNTASKIDDSGDVTSVSGDLTVTTITNYNLNWHRTHDFIGAQLNIGKQILKKGRFALFADASVSRNIWSRHAGYYFTENSVSATQFRSGEEHPYATGGYNTGLSLELEYEMNQVSISLRPFTMVGLNNITQNSNYYQIKNSQYGVQLGIVYRP